MTPEQFTPTCSEMDFPDPDPDIPLDLVVVIMEAGVRDEEKTK